jgi:hypothetical protein
MMIRTDSVRCRVFGRLARAAGIAVVLLLFFFAGLASGTDEKPDPPARETSARRVTNAHDTDRGRTEAGVDVQGISGLVSAGAATGERPESPCKWTVVHVPGDEVVENVAANEAALELRGLEPGAFISDGEWLAITLDSLAHDLAAEGVVLEDLRYVAPYSQEQGAWAPCNTAAGAWVTLGEVEDLALVAFRQVEASWPALEVALGWPEPTEDTWTALSTGMDWSPLTATASSGGLSVTVTATPLTAEWHIGEVNTRIGAPGTVVCHGPGDLPVLQDDASCRVWFAGPSTGLEDRFGQRDAITLAVTVNWRISYTSNFAGFEDPDWLVWPTTAYRDGVVVNTSQAVASASGETDR